VSVYSVTAIIAAASAEMDRRDALFLCTATAMENMRQENLASFVRNSDISEAEDQLLLAAKIWCFLTAPWKLPPYQEQMIQTRAQFIGIAHDFELQGIFFALLRPAVAAGVFASGENAMQSGVWKQMTVPRHWKSRYGQKAPFD
jgi:hypothetical protein